VSDAPPRAGLWWRIAIMALGVAASAATYLIERRLTIMEGQISALHTEVTENTAHTEANTVLLRHYLHVEGSNDAKH
jgi:hypothetical protein